ncbi:MAG: hypothetical protein WBV94_15095 [Blastocatellia bacterium]
MNEEARKQRNKQRLTECFPAFAKKLEAIIKDMENLGFRPRIQDAHRSIADQLIAFRTGHSKVRFGFHNVTGAGGKAEALAVDLLDDNNPLNPKREYLIRLASVAEAHGLQTGIFFSLPQSLRRGLRKAIDELDFRTPVKMGFDPTHVEVTGISISEAQAGARPV